MTHTGKRSNGDNGHKSAGQEKGFLSGAFFFLSLSNLLHEAAHSGSGFVLFLASGVGVGPQSEPSVEVAQHGGHCFHIHTVLQGRGSEGVTEIVESEVFQSGILQDLLVEVHHAVRVLGVLLDQQVYCCLRDGHRPHRLE